MTDWTDEDQANADAACAALTGARKTLRGLSTTNAVPKPHDIEAVRGARLSLMGAAHFVEVAARGWGVPVAVIDKLVGKAYEIAGQLAAWIDDENPRRVNLRKIFARYERLHDAIIAIGDGERAPVPRGEGGDGGGGDGGGK